jgi:hypothetical protein
VLANTARGIVPMLPALGATLAFRHALGGERTVAHVLAELAIFGVLVTAATLYAERDLLREFRGYLRPASKAATAAPA